MSALSRHKPGQSLGPDCQPGGPVVGFRQRHRTFDFVRWNRQAKSLGGHRSLRHVRAPGRQRESSSTARRTSRSAAAPRTSSSQPKTEPSPGWSLRYQCGDRGQQQRQRQRRLQGTGPGSGGRQQLPLRGQLPETARWMSSTRTMPPSRSDAEFVRGSDHPQRIRTFQRSQHRKRHAGRDLCQTGCRQA